MKTFVPSAFILVMIMVLLASGWLQTSAAKPLLDILPAYAPNPARDTTPLFVGDVLQCPSTIGFGDTIQCSIDSSGEVDTFTFTASGGDKVLVRMSLVSGNLWPGIRVLDSNETILCTAGSPSTAEIGSCNLPDSGIYTIQAYDSFNGTLVGTYNLYLQSLNNPGNAVLINFGQTISGTIGIPAEMDTYTFTPNAGDKVLLRMSTASGNLWPGIRIYSPGGDLLCTAGSPSTAEIDSCALSSGGTYTILANDSFRGTLTGTYYLYLQRLNNPGKAALITFGEILTGTIESPAEMDAYVFSADAGDSLLVKMSLLSGSLWPGIRVYDPGGTLLCSSGSPSSTKIFGCILPGQGNYTILAYDSFRGTLTGTYNIEIDVGWYVGRHSAAPIAFASEGPIEIKIDKDFSHILKIRGDPTCLPHENHDFTYEFGQTLPIAEGRFLILSVPLSIPAAPGHTHSMDIDGVFFDVDGDGTPEQGYGGFTFYSGPDVCKMWWSATLIGPDSDQDGWSNSVEQALGSTINDSRSTPENEAVPTTFLAGASVCEDFEDNDRDGLTDSSDPGCPLTPGPSLRVRVITPERVSPGQRFSYVIEYSNNGSEDISEALIFFALDESVNFVSASSAAFYHEAAHVVEWNIGRVVSRGLGAVSVEIEAVWGIPFGTELENVAIITNLDSSSISTSKQNSPTLENLFVNGVFLCERSWTYRKQSEFVRIRNLTWVQVYHGCTKLEGLKNIDDAIAADRNESHNRDNGLNELENKSYNTCWGYSGGTISVVTAIINRNLRCNHVILISPYYTNSEELQSLLDKYGVQDITIWQSDADKAFAGQYKVPENDPIRNRIRVNDRDGIEHGGERGWIACFNYTYIVTKNKSECLSIPGQFSPVKTTIANARDPNAKSADQQFARPGDRLNFTVEFENEGEGIAFGVYVTDTLDPDIDDTTLVFPSELPPLVDSFTYNPNTRTIIWYIGQVDPGVGGKLPFSAQIRSDAQDGTLITNYATVYFPSVPEVTPTNGVAVTVTTKVYLPIVLRQD